MLTAELRKVHQFNTFSIATALQVAATDAVTDLPMYQIDPVLRRAAPLQRTRDGRASAQLYGGAA